MYIYCFYFPVETNSCLPSLPMAACLPTRNRAQLIDKIK